MDLAEAQWEKLKSQLVPKRRPDGLGRPWRDAQAVVNGILWVSRTGAPWHDLPDRYPPNQTCHRRFQQWQHDGTLTGLLRALAGDLRARGKIDLSETFLDASFSSAKKRALPSTRLAEEKAVKSWRSHTAMAFLSPAASPALRRMKPSSPKPPSNDVARQPNLNE
jgi:transposase